MAKRADRAEEFLCEKSVSYTVRNIAEDEGARGGLEAMGTMTTPVAVILGETAREVVVGFDRARLEQALGL